jgi:ribonuclease P protein component
VGPRRRSAAALEQAVGRERLPRADRILSRVDYLRTQRDGRRVHTPHFLIMVHPAGRQRLGVTVTRKTAGAVGRNRIRRLAREVFRRNRALFPPACDLVLLARAGADQLDYATLQAELTAARAALARAARVSSSPQGPVENKPS